MYDDLRKETDLTAHLVQKSIRRAIEAVTGGVEKLQKGENTSQPTFDSWSVVYDNRSASFNDDHATLSTPNGRVTAEYVLPPADDREDTPFGRYYESDDWDASSATLQYDEAEDTFYLHVALKTPDYEGDGTERQEADHGDKGTENGVVLGVDLNVTGAFAVTSTGAFVGSADSLTHKRDQYERRCGPGPGDSTRETRARYHRRSNAARRPPAIRRGTRSPPDHVGRERTRPLLECHVPQPVRKPHRRLRTGRVRRRHGSNRIPDDALLDELRRLADELERPPTSIEMDDHGIHSSTTYRRRFGSWVDALDRAGLN